MKKSLLFALLMVLLAPFAMNAQDNSKDQWELVTAFSCSTGRQHAVVYDGEFIYTASWGKSSTVLHQFYKYDMNGNLLDEFDIAGFSTKNDDYLRDLTYDGTYFYGVDANSGTIKCVDLHNKTMVTSNHIVTSFTELGTCTYDPVYDAFWVGERATGSTPNLHLDLKLVNRNGVVIKTATAHNLGEHTVHGTGYFTDENGVAHLYLFAVAGFTAHVFDYQIEADVLNPNMIFDYANCPGWSYACSAGGAYVGVVDGVQCFFGDVDKSPNLIGIYALGEYTPAPPTPPTGDIFFDFEDDMLHFNTIDADGDGYCWEMRTKWGSTDNRHCATSASFDEETQTPLLPENYLVTPYKLDCEQIVFWAQAEDVAYPHEHFGVAVSTESGTDPEDFEIVWDAELSAKTEGSWHIYNVDLRAYQGQDIYVAIVHYNCTNQFMLNIDNITLFRSYNSTMENEATFATVYPNPAVNVVMVESQVVVNQYDIFNIAGEMVLSAQANEKSFEVNVNELPAGTYFIRMKSEGLTQSRRFIKK